MKRLFILLILVMGLGSLSLSAQSTKEEEQNAKMLLVRKAVESKRYKMSFDRIYPQRGQSRYIGNEYELEIKGDSVSSYLPYFGVAHSASYSGNNVLDFDKEYTDYQFKEGKKESLLVSFKVKSDSEYLEYQLTIYSNGNVRLYIQPLRRDAVSYNGALILDEKEE